MTRFSKATAATKQRSGFLIEIASPGFTPFFHTKKRRFPQAEVGSPAVTVNL
ncbi:hypothetical protein [Synechococcus sp. N5]|jgi:hypothetical protein|uniref:hypothetical protein n=1 Tax=Synechococcus sp. N5 TaxID=2575515 RepID=UPI001A7E1A3D|nr:hypothetical protein [Synechococcus sp. N5]